MLVLVLENAVSVMAGLVPAIHVGVRMKGFRTLRRRLQTRSFEF
jgi:hypothetical protein